MIRHINRLIFSVYLVLFTITFFEGTFNLPLFRFADEVTLVLSVFVLFIVAFGKVTNKLTFFFLFYLLLYLIFQLMNFLNSPFELIFAVSIMQSLINIKLIIVSFSFILVALSIHPSKSFLIYTAQTFTIIFLIGLTLNFLLQEKWNDLLHWKNEYRYGFLRPAGIFGGTHFNSYFISFASLIYFLIHVSKKRSFPSLEKLTFFSIFQVLITFPLTIRKGLLLLIPLFLSTLKHQNKSLRQFYIFLILTLFVFGWFFIRDSPIVMDTIEDVNKMSNNDSDNYYIRGLMIYNGLMLSFEFFPFGSGAATFGTVLSQYNTLEVYEYTHIPSSWYKGHELRGVYDSGFFSYLGENGWLGFVMLILILRVYLKKIKSLLNESGKKHIMVIFIFTLLMSITEPVFQNGIFTVIYSFSILYVIRFESKDTI
jgi:hypothetical protein